LLILAFACGACAHGGGPPPRDATQDPEFQAALKRAKPEFPRQSEALAAGLYEPFVPPESLAPSPPAGVGSTDLADASSSPQREAQAPSGTARGRPAEAGVSTGSGPAAPSADPSTEELLRTLPPAPRARAALPAPAAAAPRDPPGAPRADEIETVAPSHRTESMERASQRRASHSPDVDAQAAPLGPYTIQIGAFAEAAAAAGRADEARVVAPDLPVEVRRQDGWLKVFVGRFASREEGEAVLRELDGRGLGSGWVTRVVQ
jgi:cell division protein FtsN